MNKLSNKQKCQHCKKSDVRLLIISRSTSGRLHYMCRKCNTERHRKYRATPLGKERSFEAAYKSAKKFVKKQNARHYLYRAVKNGKIEKPSKCSKCDETKEIFGHHHNGYDKDNRLNVVWVCRGCHADIHRKEKDER